MFTHFWHSQKASLSKISSEAFPHVAVIGSGPSGLYVCARLLQRLPKCRIDVFEKAQAPFGLIYYGVAPDHLDMKKSMHSFERMFADNRHRLTLYCNVDVNTDITYEELCNTYEAVVLAYGANKARKLDLPNENGLNCFSGSAFVSWYNGVPWHRVSPMLDHPNALIIGNGNVAIDCARILLSTPERLAQTDITESALRVLGKSKVKHVYIVGRRGPKESSFTIKELRELLSLDKIHSYCEIDSESVEQLRQELTLMERPRRRLIELMFKYSSDEKRKDAMKENENNRTLHLQFHRRPIFIDVDPACDNRVSAVHVWNSLTNGEERIPCGLLIYAIGFENVLLEGVPRTEEGRVMMLDWCHVPDERATVYATGWCSHAARGLIADSQQQAYSVADQIVEDCELRKIKIKPINSSAIQRKLISRNVQYINWDDWVYIDECERRMGAILGKIREKITDYSSFLRIMRN